MSMCQACKQKEASIQCRKCKSLVCADCYRDSKCCQIKPQKKYAGRLKIVSWLMNRFGMLA